MASKAVFLDRDGTMAIDVVYCSRPEDFHLFPETADAIKLLRKHGFKVIVITNQSGVGRGYFTEEALRRIHEKMVGELGAKGAKLDAVYYCPHHPDDHCECRKPKPEMVLRAAREHDIDLARSFVVGNSAADIGLGKSAGCRTVLVARSLSEVEANLLKADAVATTVLEAAEMIAGWSADER